MELSEDEDEMGLVERQWRQIRGRLERKLGLRNGLVAPLAAYATDFIDDLNVEGVREVRDEYGVAGDLTAEDLMELLYFDDAETAESARPPGRTRRS